MSADSRLYWFDWVRFFASLAVVISHVIPMVLVDWRTLSQDDHTLAITTLYACGSFGQEAVILFFVVSGYLVGGKLYQRLIVGTFDIRKYAVDRLTRIYIPFIPAVVFSALVWLGLGHEIDWRQLMFNLLQLQGIAAERFAGNTVFWTLSYEVWFYVLGGALACMITMKGVGRVVAALVCAAALAIFSYLQPVYLLCWLIGASVSALTINKWTRAIFASAALLSAACLWLLSPFGVSGRDTILHQVIYLLLSMGFGLLLSTVGGFRPVGKISLVERAGTTLAEFSYTLYLTHLPVIYIMATLLPGPSEPHGLTPLFVIAAYIAACLVAAWVLYLPFEKQTTVIRRYISRWSSVVN